MIDEKSQRPSTWTLLAGYYMPGTAKALLLLATSAYLISRLASEPEGSIK